MIEEYFSAWQKGSKNGSSTFGMSALEAWNHSVPRAVRLSYYSVILFIILFAVSGFSPRPVIAFQAITCLGVMITVAVLHFIEKHEQTKQAAQIHTFYLKRVMTTGIAGGLITGPKRANGCLLAAKPRWSSAVIYSNLLPSS